MSEKRMIKILCAVMALAMLLGLTACKKEKSPAQTQPEPEAEQNETVDQTEEAEKTDEEPVEVDVPYLFFETSYCTLQYPSEYGDYLIHGHTEADGAEAEVFSMAKDGTTVELFRIIFGAAADAETLGVLNVEDEQIPVSYTTCIFAQEDFADEESWTIYSGMMDGFSTMLNSIQADENFSVGQSTGDDQPQTAKLTYWEVTLPAGVTWEETTQDDVYRVIFRGEVAGQTMDLYAVCIGDTQAENVFGTYNDKPVTIENFELEVGETWTEEDTAMAYTMKGSINDVITVISADPEFTAK